jgi:hypothetical protein
LDSESARGYWVARFSGSRRVRGGARPGDDELGVQTIFNRTRLIEAFDQPSAAISASAPATMSLIVPSSAT